MDCSRRAPGELGKAAAKEAPLRLSAKSWPASCCWK